ncbi:hypothetical protein HZA38_03045 [Candidatus Peregrinibacteria bacterium]|nr:hypothetical protein [Candidatus Peregrinibacteria bacterium]
MKISPEMIREYQEIHLQEFGVALEDSEAEKEATRMLQLFEILFFKK